MLFCIFSLLNCVDGNRQQKPHVEFFLLEVKEYQKEETVEAVDKEVEVQQQMEEVKEQVEEEEEQEAEWEEVVEVEEDEEEKCST